MFPEFSLFPGHKMDFELANVLVCQSAVVAEGGLILSLELYQSLAAEVRYLDHMYH